MVDIKNIAKEKLQAGELAIGVGLRQARTVDIAKAMKTAGFDWLFIDMEHNSMNLDTATQISVTAQDVGITPLLRVPGFQHFHASRALDGGAQGIVVPHVDTKETAIQMVHQCKYSPLGHRSLAGAQPMLDFQSLPVAEATKAVNDATLTVLMLETPTAIRNANDIASVEGVDCLLIGTNDLCMEMGIPGELDHPEIIEAYKQTITACKKHGKFVGMGGVYNFDSMRVYIDMGVQLVLAGNDLSFMISAGREQTNKLRSLA